MTFPTLVLLATVSSLAPTDMLMAAGFDVKFDRTASSKLSGKAMRGAPPTSFDWRVTYDTPRSETIRFDEIQSTTGMVKSLPSGLPFASDVYFLQEPDDILIHASTGFERVQVKMLLQGSDERGFYKAFPHDWTQDKKLLERFARTALARGAGARLGTLANKSFGGYTATGATCRRTSRVLVDVREWASRHGWSVQENEDLAYLMLRNGTRYAVLPAGANLVKVDGSWRKMPDVVMQKEGRWLAIENDMRRLLL